METEKVSIAEEVKRVLLEHPEILVEVLTDRPQVLYEALAKVAPWERLATKEDVIRLEGKIAEVERRLSLKIDALGACWDVASEEAFRAGAREFLKEAGFSVDRWVYFDEGGGVRLRFPERGGAGRSGQRRLRFRRGDYGGGEEGRPRGG